jgi:hypothetical protein
VNRVSGLVHQLRQVLTRIKKANRSLYYTVKYAMWASILYAVFLRNLHWVR